MLKDADMNLTCRHCGSHFVFTKVEQKLYEVKGFTIPSYCKECRSSKQNQTDHLACSHCGAELKKGAPIYCNACLASVHLESKLKTEQRKREASAAYTKLQASESQKAEIAELLRQKEQLVAELETKFNSLGQDLEKAVQFHAALEWLQPALHEIEERLGALEHTQNKVNERMLQLVEKMHEMYEHTGLLEIIKRSLKRYEGEVT